MPELPEVETTRRGIAPFVMNQTIAELTVRQSALRWPIPADLPRLVRGQRIDNVGRRGKYLLLRLERGTLILHLGMSGSLRVCDPRLPPRKHDHFDIVLEPALALRFHDPRRFGCLLWTDQDPEQHPLLAGLGVEPLGQAFTGSYLYRATRSRSAAVKLCLMDHRLVVGVGNIYASESLFRAGIDPRRAAHRVSEARYERLVDAVRAVLEQALAAGGTTLRDFVNERGSPGYFKQTLMVYDRAGEPCRVCGASIRRVRTGQRSTFFCSACQH